MIQIRRILCPIDFSEFSRRALEHAVAVARWYDAEITLLHVAPFVPSVATSTFPPGVSPLMLEPMPHAAVLEELRRFAQPAAAAGLRFDAVVRDGSAVTGVLDLARTLPADLLVMGTHGRGGFDRLVLGSVAEKVLRKACYPVLTVPLPAAGVPAGVAPLFGRVLCAVDFSPSSMKALDYALSLAQEAQASLMGVRGRGAVDLMLFGSTTHHVIREAHRPVLTVRGR